MKSLSVVVISIAISGCIQTRNIDGSYPATLIQSDGTQRNSVLVRKGSGYIYCPDAPAEVTRSHDDSVKASGSDVAGNNPSAEGALKMLAINLTNRNNSTNNLVYLINGLCFIAMNGFIAQSDVKPLFEKIIESTTKTAEIELASAQAAKNVAEAEKNKTETVKNETTAEKDKAAAEKSNAEAKKNATEAKKIENQLQLQQFKLQNKLMD